MQEENTIEATQLQSNSLQLTLAELTRAVIDLEDLRISERIASIQGRIESIRAEIKRGKQ
jgi:hypothetical protein